VGGFSDVLNMKPGKSITIMLIIVSTVFISRATVNRKEYQEPLNVFIANSSINALIRKETSEAQNYVITYTSEDQKIKTERKESQQGGDSTSIEKRGTPEPSIAKPITSNPELGAEIAYIRGVNDRFPSYKRGATKRWPIASITKLMTALIAEEYIPKETKIVFTEHSIETEGTAGSFVVGDVFLKEDVISAMLVTSSNDAAVALARNLGKEKFMQFMNEKATTLGLRNTTFADASGLSYLNQSTAEDLFIFMKYLHLIHPEILEITRLKEVKIKELETGTVHEISNINALVTRSDYVGGKTGYTDEARQNLLSLFRDRDSNYTIVIILGSANRFDETVRLYNWHENR